MASQRSPYAILSVTPDAESVVIEAAYRALMKKYHPDQGSAAAAGGPSASDIHNAFATLRDPQRRADYDHREAVRVQALQLAQYLPALPPPARRSNFFGWGGWLVSLLLAGALGIIASQSGGLPPLPRAEAVKAAPLAGSRLRSQPEIPAVDLVPPAELAEIRADALLGRTDTNGASAGSVHQARAEQSSHAHAAPRRHQAAKGASGDKDFVERHGGIY